MTPLLALATAWWAVMTAVPLVAASRARRAFPENGGRPTPIDLLVRPCTGTPVHLEEALLSTGAARGLIGARVRFTVDDANDPALPVAQAAAQALRDRGLDAWAVVASGPGANRKAAQLLAIVKTERPEGPVVVVDADVDLTDEPLDQLAAAAHAPGFGAAWRPVVEIAGTTPADAASAALLGASLHAFALLGHLDPHGLVGKLFAFAPSRIRAAGHDVERLLSLGLDTLGEDMAFAAGLQKAGLHIALCPGAGRSLLSGRTWDTVVERYTRWILVIRTQRPGWLVSYPLLFLAAPLLVMTGLGLALSGEMAGLTLVASTLFSRLLTARLAIRLSGRRTPPGPGALLAADRLLATAFLRALRARDVSWGGRRIELRHLRPLESPPA